MNVQFRKTEKKEHSTAGAGTHSQPITDNRPASIAQRKTKTTDPVHSRNGVAQLFPYSRRNTRTNRTFSIIHMGNEITAIQTAGNPDDVHFGSLTYVIRRLRTGNIFELSHIISDPETGSGIGALLVYFMCEVAENMGFAEIEIPTAAPTAIGFYEHLGWEATRKDRIEPLTKMIAENDEGELLNAYFENTARVAYNSDPENHTKKTRGIFSREKTQLTWKNLRTGEQLKLIEAEKKKFSQSGKGEQEKLQQMLFHNKAVANIGMIGKTATIKQRALGSVNKTWEDPQKKLWDEVWEARNKPGYTSFPKHPDEE